MTTDIQRAVNLLSNGDLVAFPTETVYGLGGDATNAVAVEKIFRLKGRPSNHNNVSSIQTQEPCLQTQCCGQVVQVPRGSLEQKRTQMGS